MKKKLVAYFSQEELISTGEWILSKRPQFFPDELINEAIFRLEPDSQKSKRLTYAAAVLYRHLPAIERSIYDIESISIWESEQGTMIETKFRDNRTNN